MDPIRSTLLALVGLALFAQAAEASRPFDEALLNQPGSEPADARVMIQTVVGPDKPRRMVVGSNGANAEATELKNRRGRWLVTQDTPEGETLISAIRADLETSGSAKLRAVGLYQCHARFRVSFRLTAINDPAEARFEDASLCPD